MTICSKCGYEYNAHVHWLVCPRCGNETGNCDELRQYSVKSLDFSNRVLHCLKRNDILTVGQLVDTPPSVMMRWRSFGRSCLEEVRHVLAKSGLELKYDFECDFYYQ